MTQSFAGPCVTTFKDFREQSGSQQQEQRASSKGENIFSAKSETLQSTRTKFSQSELRKNLENSRFSHYLFKAHQTNMSDSGKTFKCPGELQSSKEAGSSRNSRSEYRTGKVSVQSGKNRHRHRHRSSSTSVKSRSGSWSKVQKGRKWGKKTGGQNSSKARQKEKRRGRLSYESDTRFED